MSGHPASLLTLNAGSSSVKFSLIALDGNLTRQVSGKVADLGTTPSFRANGNGADDVALSLNADIDVESALAFILDWIEANVRPSPIAGVAHRIVHGGPERRQGCELTPAIIRELRDYAPLAPLHQPHNLAAVDALWRRDPSLRQFGCFDTAFHTGLGPLAREMALPETIRQAGVRRYGYHGLNYAWVAHRLRKDHPALAHGRVVVAHLGSGASLCALKDGVSVDTTMSMSALDGLPMATRSGSLDPGVILFMQTVLGMGPAEVEAMLYHECGLKGLSGISGDVRQLLASREPRARFALDYFAYRTAQQIAAMAVAAGGLNLLVFTGGIGENAAPVRQAILDRLTFLPAFETLIIPADEETFMAMEIAPFLSARPI